MINIQDLNKSFGKKQVLKDLNLSLNNGMIHGIVGANGAGKTTLFKCMCQLETFEGNIGVSQKDKIGFLPTSPYMLPKITGEEYLHLLAHARGICLKEHKDLNPFELPLKSFAENYSTGMKKKLALTALLLQQNEIYILDEPFNGVDIHSNLIIQQIISDLKAMGKTVIISSHIFSSLTESSDRIHFLKDGRISKSATPDHFKQVEDEMKGEQPSINLKAIMGLKD